MCMWEGLGNNFIPDLHRLFFGFPVLEDVKHLSLLGGIKKSLKMLQVLRLPFYLE